MRCHKENVQECFKFQHKKGQTNLTRNILCTHGLGDQGFDSWQGQEIFLFFKTSRPALGAHPACYSMGTRVLSLQVKWLRFETDHLPPSRAEVKNEWRYTFTFCVCLDEVHGGDLIFYKSV
jgi:hypothetical protein